MATAAQHFIPCVTFPSTLSFFPMRPHILLIDVDCTHRRLPRDRRRRSTPARLWGQGPPRRRRLCFPEPDQWAPCGSRRCRRREGSRHYQSGRHGVDRLVCVQRNERLTSPSSYQIPTLSIVGLCMLLRSCLLGCSYCNPVVPVQLMDVMFILSAKISLIICAFTYGPLDTTRGSTSCRHRNLTT